MDTVNLPKLGQTMEEAVIEKWHVKEGDTVKKGDILLEITTDKATLEVESYVSGTVRKLLASDGETKGVGEPIAFIGSPDEEMPDISRLQKPAPAKAAPEAAPAPAKKEASAASGKPGRVRATPRAKKLARELGVDISTLTGTGPGGRITEDDVKSGGSGGGASAAAPVEGVKKQPLSAMRRVIAENMSKSSQEAPHFYLMTEIDMTKSVELRAKLKAESNVSYNDMITKACATGLSELSGVNSTWLGDGVGIRDSVGVGLAVSVDDGLIVPVIRDADKKDLKEIAVDSANLIKKARDKKLTPDEYGNGSITISNLGMLGIDSFLPIINLGESVILGIGRIIDKAVVVDGEICIRKMMNVTLSCDHRVVDGALGAQFLARVKELLE